MTTHFMYTQGGGFKEHADAAASFGKVKSKQVKNACREIANQTNTKSFHLNQVSSKSIPPIDSLTFPETSKMQANTSNRKRTVSKPRKKKKIRAEDILKELDKPDRTRALRILKSFILTPEQLDPEGALKAQQNKME